MRHSIRGIQECRVKYASKFTVGLRFTHSVHASDSDITFPILTDSLKDQLGRLGQIDRANADSENICFRHMRCRLHEFRAGTSFKYGLCVQV